MTLKTSAIEVYLNADGDVVMKQTDTGISDSFIVFPRYQATLMVEFIEQVAKQDVAQDEPSFQAFAEVGGR